jgi:hypothetical protein
MAQAERYYNFLSRDEALGDVYADPDNPMTPEEFRYLREAHRLMKPALEVIEIEHLGYDGARKVGQMVVHGALVDTTQELFAYLMDKQFAIHQIKPHVLYGYNDAKAMADNNTSGYRPGFNGGPLNGGTNREILSKHCAGVALDTETEHNKQRNADGTVAPPYVEGYVFRPESRLMYHSDIRQHFSEAGFEYGGTWPLPEIVNITGYPDFYPGAPADEHHFEVRDQKNPDDHHLFDMQDLVFPAGIAYEHPGKMRLV